MELRAFTNRDIGISGIAPDGWTEKSPGRFHRGASVTDQTALLQEAYPGAEIADIKEALRPRLGLDTFPERVGTLDTPRFAWDLHVCRVDVLDMEANTMDIALTQAGACVYFVALVAPARERDTLYDAVFLPAVNTLMPALADRAYASEIDKYQLEHERLLREARKGLRAGAWPDFPCLSDQERGIPIPPQQKPYDETAELVSLPNPDESVLRKSSILDCIADRKSRRKYSGEDLTLEELAYLLWATQGVREVSPSGKRSLRTVPSGGSRQPFETYLAINHVEGIAPGVYRYLPFEHRLVHLFSDEELSDRLTELANGQAFVGKSAVCFIWSAIPYRMEWRYGLQAMKDILQESGHICQNLYLACESIRCGTCAIAAYDQDKTDRFLGLDGVDELVVYLAPVGRVE